MSVLDNLKAANATAKANGSFPIIKNSANGKMKNLKLFGASTKAEGQIESVVLNSVSAHGAQLLDLEANTSSTTNGFNVSVESGYILTATGTPTAVWANLTNFDTKKLPKGKYTFSIDKTPTELGLNLIGIKFRKSIDDSENVTYLITGSNKSITLERTEDYELVQIYVEGCDTSKSYNFTIKIMLNVGEIALPFEAFNANIANLPEAIEMNGNGELKDYIDYERGVFVQKFGVVVFDGSSDEEWAFNELSQRLTITGLPIKRTSNNDEIPNILCNQFLTKSPNQTYQKVEGITVNTYGVLHIYSDDFNTSDVSLWKAHLQSNPMTVVYELAEPIETPLSPAALLELNKLRTFDSITCVSNDAGAEMEIEYFKNSKIGQEMSDIHAGVPRFILDGTTLNIIV